MNASRPRTENDRTTRRPGDSGPRRRGETLLWRMPVSRLRNRVTVAAPYGEMDVAVAGALRRDLARVTEHRNHVMIDLAGVALIDCTCLGILLAARERTLGHGQRFCLTTPAPVVSRVLRLTALDTVFPVFPDRRQALRHLGVPATAARGAGPGSW